MMFIKNMETGAKIFGIFSFWELFVSMVSIGGEDVSGAGGLSLQRR